MDDDLQYFSYTHLPQHLQDVSRPFCELAYQVKSDMPKCSQRTLSLHFLLLAKDAAVRAKLFKAEQS